MVGQKTYTIPKDTQIKRDGNILFLSYAIPNFSIDMKIKECNDMGAYGVILVFAGLASVPVPPLALSFMTAAGGMAIGQLNCALSFF
jgi:hypothetical protein